MNFSKAYKHKSEVKRLKFKQNKYTGTYTKLQKYKNIMK